MTREEIISMAREVYGQHEFSDEAIFLLEKFANLVAIKVAASEREWMQETNVRLIAEAVSAEREACAIVCDRMVMHGQVAEVQQRYNKAYADCRDKIRERGVKREMSNSIPFTGITKLNPDMVLGNTKGKLEGAVIIDYTKDGEEHFASTYADGGTVMARVRELEEALADIARVAGRDIPDRFDNDGKPYQSSHLSALIEQALSATAREST